MNILHQVKHKREENSMEIDMSLRYKSIYAF